MNGRVSVSAAEARRIALAAQGFDKRRPSAPSDIRHFRRVMRDISVLQLDFVNVLIPAHFLMIYSRLGPYDRRRFESYLYDSGEHTEQWAHEASIVSSTDWPLLAHRRREYQQWKTSPLHTLPDKEAYLRSVLRQVKKAGSITSKDLPVVDGPKKKPGDWHRSIPRWALEHHFGKGKLAVRRRLTNFQRVYDLPERLIDERFRTASIQKSDAQRELLRKASDALGIATCQDLADYHRMTPTDAAPRIDELVSSGALTPVEVAGWSQRAYLAASARSPRSIPGASLLSPFDPMVWYRPRAMRLFGFEYRIEIYVPAPKRRWGYYVLPFRQGDEITARVDLKSERQASVLVVQHAHVEDCADSGETAAALANELLTLAKWLSLDDVQVKTTSAFEKALVAALRAA